LRANVERRDYRPLELDGDFTAGPLLPPGCPGIFDASCVVLPGACVVVEPGDMVDEGRWAGGPFLLPGWPAIPAPEFGAWPAPDGAVLCDIAGDAIAATTRAAAASLSMQTSCVLDRHAKAERVGPWRHTVTTLRCADRSCGDDSAGRPHGRPARCGFFAVPLLSRWINDTMHVLPLSAARSRRVLQR
jgi:hypothetical protein